LHHCVGHGTGHGLVGLSADAAEIIDGTVKSLIDDLIVAKLVERIPASLQTGINGRTGAVGSDTTQFLRLA